MAKSGSPAGQQATYGYREFLFGGLGACAAGCITNPLEVVKTRFQLQGELKARGHYVRTYRNVFHAFYTIGRVDGLLALQKGLVPALWYQFFMNGVRLGAFQSIKNLGFTADSRGSQSLWKNVVAGAMSGTVGAIVGSPVYMVKTHLQARAHEKIAVGFQHRHTGMLQAMQGIYREYGVRGLWRGVSGAIPRVMVGSAAQLSTFSMAHEWIEGLKVFKAGSIVTSLAAATMSGSVVVLFMTPFDVVSTRLYNQGVDARGRGLYYSGFTDCFTKVLAKEGVWGFYKGWGASLFRLGPHTVLSLVCWTEIRKAYHELESYGSDGTCS